MMKIDATCLIQAGDALGDVMAWPDIMEISGKNYFLRRCRLLPGDMKSSHPRQALEPQVGGADNPGPLKLPAKLEVPLANAADICMCCSKRVMLWRGLITNTARRTATLSHWHCNKYKQHALPVYPESGSRR